MHEVRWYQFTLQIFEATLKSWKALVTFFQISDEPESNGFLSYLIDSEILELMVFTADILTVFTRHQKVIQGDSVTKVDVSKKL